MVLSFLLHPLLAANRRRSIGALAAFFCIALSPLSYAESAPVGRYVDISVNADNEQLWPLVKTVSANNRDCPDIRCAVDHVIRQVGYSVYPGAMAVSAMNTLNKPVPSNHLRFDNIRIIEVVHALMGPAYQILVDPYDRYISFELRRTKGLQHISFTGNNFAGGGH